MARPPGYERLATEHPNRDARALDRMSVLEIARLMNREDRRPADAVRRVLPTLARGIDVIVASLRGGGRLFFVGAGTSGRLGVLEAAECPPTFGTPSGMVQAIMAGGRGAVFRSREGAEDDAVAGRLAGRRLRAGDVVVGISASGMTAFVRAVLIAARRTGARTVLVSCNPRVPRGLAEVVISPTPGPEVVAGSTRLKAGTTTKLVLNILTTATMVRLGKVYENRMIDLQPRSRKLSARAVRLVEEVAGVTRGRARRALATAAGRVRLAIVMAHTGQSARAAQATLRRHDGDLRGLLGHGVMRPRR
jgi:N-acetylmuramic acid 6-phosphate etherase